MLPLWTCPLCGAMYPQRVEHPIRCARCGKRIDNKRTDTGAPSAKTSAPAATSPKEGQYVVCRFEK